MAERFTMDGSDALEAFLQQACAIVRESVCARIPERRLEALVLGGGYGRGQGGVLRDRAGDHPYNDLEFYVFTRGNRLLNARRYTPELDHIGHVLSPKFGLHVEFKVDSIARMRRAAVSMFSYDLVTAHRMILGPEDTFRGCEHHLDASLIPVSEATRLLFNRCSGLLLAREKLDEGLVEPEDIDFVARNIAKAQLALGDALLAARKQYHWSCLERHERLKNLQTIAPCFDEISAHHAIGVSFKLHPRRSTDRLELLRERHAAMTKLARDLWLFIEGERLQKRFSSPAEYAACPEVKCNETPGWLNYLLNLRTFGPRAILDRGAARYPRERLLNALPLLLWGNNGTADPQVRRLLHAPSGDRRDLVAAYKEVWPAYG